MSQFIEMFGNPSTNDKGWKVEDMKTACLYISDGSHYSPSDDTSSSIPMLSVKDMTNHGFLYSNCKHLSRDDYEKLCANGCKPIKDDVLVAKDGSYFKYIFPLEEEIEQAILSSIAILRPDQKKITPRFLCEYLKSKDVLDIVERNYLTGTAIRRVILKGFKDIQIYLPPLSLQIAFETIYNQADKSEFNVIKSQFIEMFGAEKKVILEQICNVEKGNTITRNEVSPGNIPVVAGGQEPSCYHNESNRDAGMITVSASGAYAGFVNYWTCPIFASDCNTISPKAKEETDTIFLYYGLKAMQSQIYGLQKGGAQPHVYGKDLKELLFPCPSIERQHCFSKIAILADKSELVLFQNQIDLLLQSSPHQ